MYVYGPCSFQSPLTGASVYRLSNYYRFLFCKEVYHTSLLGHKSSGGIVGTTSLVQVIVTETVMPNRGDGVASSEITVMVTFVENL
jgi:hypothetical protein